MAMMMPAVPAARVRLMDASLLSCWCRFTATNAASAQLLRGCERLRLQISWSIAALETGSFRSVRLAVAREQHLAAVTADEDEGEDEDEDEDESLPWWPAPTGKSRGGEVGG